MNLSSLQKRTFSAFVMGAIVLAITYIGGWLFLGLVAVCGLVAFYEWVKLSLKTDKPYVLLAFGAAYIFTSMWCSYQIRASFGVEIAFLFVIMVWASDTGGYFVGKALGGPKLAEEISPNKTWSGYAGALFFPAVFGSSYILAMNFGSLEYVFLGGVFVIGALMGITGQAGDLLVSWLKRRASVKDTGNIIPGHGGILDRIDSLLLCAPVFLYFMGLLIFYYGK